MLSEFSYSHLPSVDVTGARGRPCHWYHNSRINLLKTGHVSGKGKFLTANYYAAGGALLLQPFGQRPLNFRIEAEIGNENPTDRIIGNSLIQKTSLANLNSAGEILGVNSGGGRLG